MKCIVVAAAVVAFAQSAQAQSTLDGIDTDRETAAQLARIVESAKSRGLPTDPIVAQVRHGALIHVAPARLVAAAQAVARRLDQSREALGADAPLGDIAAGQDALSIKGVTGQMLRDIRATQPNVSVAVPIGVVAQLVASGVQPGPAAETVRRLMLGHATNSQLVGLGNDVNHDVAAGAGAMSSFLTRLEMLRPVLAPVGASSSATLTAPITTSGKPRP